MRAHANRNPAALMYDKPMFGRRLHGGGYISEPPLPVRQLPRDGRYRGGRAGLGRRAPGCPTRRRWCTPSTGLHRQHRVDGHYYCDDPLMDRPGPAQRSCVRGPTSDQTASTWRRSTTRSTRSSSCPSRVTGSASGARRRTSSPTGTCAGRRVPADQHLGRRALRGVRPRVQPGHRRRPPASRDVDQPGGRRPDLSRHLRRGCAHERHRPAGGMTMGGSLEVRIDSDVCMGSGNCVFWAPDTFDLSEDGHAVVTDAEATDGAVAHRRAGLPGGCDLALAGRRRGADEEGR